MKLSRQALQTKKKKNQKKKWAGGQTKFRTTKARDMSDRESREVGRKVDRGGNLCTGINITEENQGWNK